ncbi:MAG TPA: hypothetical protein VHT52_22945 [Stellaceae bacterium]|jgi:hypothetical protein|nr:hypothetical protein [Stellaceae bacterium]
MKVQRALAFLTEPLGWRSAIVLSAALAVVWQLAMPVELPVSATPSSASATAPVVADLVTAVVPAYPAIAEHPLFYATRQPWAPPPPTATPSVPQAPAPTAPHPLQKYQLVGVVISKGARAALLKPSDGSKTVTISEGQQLSGWTLRQISPDALHFESGGDTFDIKFPTPRWPR